MGRPQRVAVVQTGYAYPHAPAASQYIITIGHISSSAGSQVVQASPQSLPAHGSAGGGGGAQTGTS